MSAREQLIREAWDRVREHFWRYPSGFNTYLHDPESAVQMEPTPADQAVPPGLACEVVTFSMKIGSNGAKWIECEGIVVERR